MFVEQCSDSQKVKVENQKSAKIVKEITIPLWKWKAINIDFIIGLPQSH